MLEHEAFSRRELFRRFGRRTALFGSSATCIVGAVANFVQCEELTGRSIAENLAAAADANVDNKQYTQKLTARADRDWTAARRHFDNSTRLLIAGNALAVAGAVSEWSN